MKVVIDCYRVLGVTPQTPLPELQQIYHDRVHCLPHRDYTDRTVRVRDELIAVVYQALTNPEANQPLDALPIEYAPEQIAGVLLLLLELGEYQEVVDLGYHSLEQAQLDLGYGDILLSIAKAHLELAKELYQQAQYEQSAELLESAHELLTREGGSINLRTEIQRELDLMRPHRILELLSAPDHNHAQRQLGIQLFKDLLHDRHGIDGRGNDRSELVGDDFLRFLQQVRTYLTASEQQSIFAEESRRPCTVAAYLHAYALVAQGFSEQKPSLIRQARGIFVKVGAYQETYLEQAVCYLLLGQPEQAMHCAERTTNATELQYIREHSVDNDLLLGLCWYCEKWLREEVYASFRDLQHKTHLISLKVYFADPQVQAYLEELVDTPEFSPATNLTSPSLSSRWTRSPHPEPAPAERPRKLLSRKPSYRKFAIPLVIVALLGAGIVLFARPPQPPQTETPPPPITPIAPVTPTTTPVLDRATAKQVVEKWQKAKARAMGRDYDTAPLGEILAEPELSQWQEKSANLKQEGTYIVYQLQSVEIQEVKVEGEETTIVATVVESRTTNRNGEVIDSESADHAAYQVEYKAILENNQWRIKGIRSL